MACPKCGRNDRPSASEFPQDVATSSHCYGCKEVENEEHLHRCCRDCGFTWPEATKDAG